MSLPLFQNIFILRRRRVANFSEIIKNFTMFNEITLEDSKKIKDLEIMHKNAIYTCIS